MQLPCDTLSRQIGPGEIQFKALETPNEMLEPRDQVTLLRAEGLIIKCNFNTIHC